MQRKRIIATALAALALAVILVSGCATVRPWERELLSDRIMDPGAVARERAAERHWVETREGAMGGPLGAGGGCACN
jgi:hypothetical protein